MRACARPAGSRDWDGMLDVILAANPHLHSRIQRFRAAGAPWHNATPIVCSEDGEIRSTAVIFRRCIWTRVGYAKVAGIGAVATHPAFRNRGLAGAAIAACEERLRSEGCPLAVLFCSIPAYYERLGWQTLPLSSPSLPESTERAAGLQERALDLARDWTAMAGVYQRAGTGAVQRSPQLWREFATWAREDSALAFGAWNGPDLVAYTRGRVGNEGLEILEATALPGYEHALGFLLHRQAAIAGATPAFPTGTFLMVKPLQADTTSGDTWLNVREGHQDPPWHPRVWWPIDRF